MIKHEEDRLVVAIELFNKIVERLWNPLEMKVVLAVIALGGQDEPVQERELLGHKPLRSGARGDGSSRPVEERIREALDGAVTRQALLPIALDAGERAFLVWNEDNLARVSRRKTERESAGTSSEAEVDGMIRPGIFTEYEQNIGMLTPVIADRLADAIERYPKEWVSEAIQQAAIYNRRSLRYVERILENWAAEGRNGEADRRNHEEHSSSGSRLRDKVQPYLRERE